MLFEKRSRHMVTINFQNFTNLLAKIKHSAAYRPEILCPYKQCRPSRDKILTDMTALRSSTPCHHPS